VYYKVVESKASHQVLIFYTYQDIEKPEETASWLKNLAETYHLLGRAIVAEEGINATFEGQTRDTEAFTQEFKKDSRFAEVHIKTSDGDGKSFPKLKVKVRQEIVGTHFPKEVDPRKKTAPRIPPQELRDWYEKGKEFVIVDMRNDYEFASGHFKGSVPAGIGNSRELPSKVKELAHLKDKTVLTVCTAGVRCEKMSAFLLHEGFGEVYQLDGGIHSYMQQYPGEDYQGTLYTFDNRITMDFGGDREIIGLCRLCGEKTENYVNCANSGCHLHFLACDMCAPKEMSVYCKVECRETKEIGG
jgi:UPF0176 protein